MRKLLLVAVAATLAAGCSKPDTAKPDPATATTTATPTTTNTTVAPLTVDQVDQALTAKQAQAVDANGPDTRKEMGVVPGAILLDESKDDHTAELPADKNKELVFYCANTHCGASHEAAKSAVVAGYTNVKVMPDGIAGWVKAGKTVQHI